ncbi:MAG: hypothetical protein ABJF10_23365 [Chthoniobacter sp.]|uniref:hypothetical protein n=1 Tax=Chthoniobacter sp. TaxID=2510640 RepID=UPI0032AE6CAB
MQLKHRDVQFGLMVAEYRKMFFGFTKWMLLGSSSVVGLLYVASLLLPKPMSGAAMMFVFLLGWLPALILFAPFLCRVLLPIVTGILEIVRIILHGIQFMVPEMIAEMIENSFFYEDIKSDPAPKPPRAHVSSTVDDEW